MDYVVTVMVVTLVVALLGGLTGWWAVELESEVD